MEPNIEVYYKNNECKRKEFPCFWTIFSLVAIALSFFVGVLVAALTGIIDTLTTGGIIALIIIFAVLLVITLINVFCCTMTNTKKHYC